MGKTSHPQTLTCPAQGSPVPAFRCPHNKISLQRASGRISSQTDRGSSACLHGRFSNSTHCPVVSCPRGSCPSFQVLSVKINMFTEPVGGSPPKFSDNSKISSVDSHNGRYSTLLCPAQGSPVPAFRSTCFLSTVCVHPSYPLKFDS